MSETPAVPADREDAFDLSVVVPLYNEVESAEHLYDDLKEPLDALGISYEIVLVDDGSTDGTNVILQELTEDPCISVVVLGRNYGQTAALSAGFEYARGAVIVSIDGDLQNDPRDIGKLLERMKEGYDVVSGWRHRRKDRFLTRILPSRAANWIISFVSGVKLHDYGCTLKAYRRSVIQNLRLYGEQHRFIPIYAFWQGARITEERVNHRSRQYGKSKYGLERTAKVLLDLIVIRFLDRYAQKPIYIYGGFGLICMFLGIFAALAAFYYKYVPDPPDRKFFIDTPLPMLSVLMLVMGAMSVLMGLLAEISIRNYHESQNIATYQIKRVIRHDTDASDPPDSV